GYNLGTANSKYASSLDEIKSFIPDEFLQYFSFPGKYEAEQYLNLAQKSHLAIFASRVETFCLAAHELNWMGMPLILADIPAFKEHFKDGINACKFDGTIESLTQLLMKIIENPKMLAQLEPQPVSEFDINIFDKIINLPENNKINANYILFTKMQEIYFNQGNIYFDNFKYLTVFS
ncbi:MAG: glycosyltransferase, partial [Sphaerospermopsis kisseleviana]